MPTRSTYIRGADPGICHLETPLGPFSGHPGLSVPGGGIGDGVRADDSRGAVGVASVREGGGRDPVREVLVRPYGR